MKQVLLNSEKQGLKARMSHSVSLCVQSKAGVVSIFILPVVLRYKLATREHSEWKYYQNFAWSTWYYCPKSRCE